MLRIISGIHKGKKIKTPDYNITRPTIERIREAIFSSIQFYIKGSTVLDLFSGSGIFSFESISRGAMKSIAVDNNYSAIQIINENKATLNIKNVTAVCNDASKYPLSKTGTKFNLIFIDPPYTEIHLYNQTLKNIAISDILANNGYILLETNNVSEIEIPKNYLIQKRKKYGNIYILLISKL